MANARKAECPVERYARTIVTGRIVAGRLVRLACERHLRDLRDGRRRGLVWDSDAARRALEFYGFLKHSKGEWAGQRVELQPWQQFIIGSVFGWKRVDGTRRFRTAYNELSRKNGKSTIAAGVGLYLLTADEEPGAEVYTGATKRDQARIVHGEAVRMVRKSPWLKKRVGIFKDNLHVPATESKYEPLGADADTLDGLNVHGCIIDEYHAHRSRALLDVMDTATGARRQPLIFIITTAGHDRRSACFQEHEYALRVLEGTVRDDSYFAYVATIDEEDNWEDERCWIKANPNLGCSVSLEDLRRKAHKARELPTAQNAFKRLHLDIWTDQETIWLPRQLWARGNEPAVRPEDLERLPCYGGLDLANRYDLVAYVLLFPNWPEEGHFGLWPQFWIPRECAIDREKRDRVPYRLWAEQGWVTLTDGDVTDYDVVEAAVKASGDRWIIRGIAYDPWNATQMALRLQTYGLPVHEFPQKITRFNEPTKEWERLLRDGKLHHGNHPVLTWQAGNAAVTTDNSGNIRPVKPEHQSARKIDGVVAGVMALGLCIGQGGDETSVYESRGLAALD